MKGFLRESSASPFVHLIVILVIGLAAYSNTFYVPFHLDDFYIKANPFVKGIDVPADYIKNAGSDLYDHTVNRYVAYLTFALNYRLGGFDVFGYHVVNIALHLMTAMLLYAFVVLVFETPLLRHSEMAQKRHYLGFFTALVFVAHPVQTEAVNWIWQRVAVLSAFFYVAAVVTYMKARLETEKKWRKTAFFMLSLVATVLAMKTKQNSFTIPFMIALCEFVFFEGPIRTRLAALVPFAATLLIIPFSYLFILDFSFQQSTAGISNPLAAEISRNDYLITQIRAMATYIRLLFVPVNLPIFQEFRLYDNFFDREVLLSFFFLAVLSGTAIVLLIAFRKMKSGAVLAGFGIIWFFVAFAVETVIPQYSLFCKYRLYLPSAGIFLSVIAVSYFIAQKIPIKERNISMILAIIVIVLAVSTYARNEVWRTEVSLQKDTVKNNPDSAIAHLLLGNAYKNEGMPEEAAREFERAFMLDEKKRKTDDNAYPDKAMNMHREMPLAGNADMHYSLAENFYRNRQYGDALRELQTVVVLDPAHAGAYYHMGLIYHETGKRHDAEAMYKKAVSLRFDFVEARTNLGGVYAESGRFEEAINMITSALRINPGYADAHRFLGLIYHDLGRLDESVRELKTAIRLDEGHAEAHNSLGEVYEQMGKKQEAVAAFRKALTLNPDLEKARRNLGKNMPGTEAR